MMKAINHHREGCVDSLLSTCQANKYVCEAIDVDTFDGPPSAAEDHSGTPFTPGTTPSVAQNRRPFFFHPQLGAHFLN